jgi:hypothetical protein
MGRRERISESTSWYTPMAGTYETIDHRARMDVIGGAFRQKALDFEGDLG